MTGAALVVAFEALDPDPDTARDWLRDELSRPEYQPSLVERFREWVADLFDGVRGASEAIGGFNPVVAVGALALLIALGAFVLSRLQANPSPAGGDRPVFDDVRLSAADHRDLARRAVELGDWHAVVVESMRALASGLFERGILVEDAGATADEISANAARAFPTFAEGLARAALVFDETLYGDRPAGEPRARELSALEEDLRSATPSQDPSRTPMAAVPR